MKIKAILYSITILLLMSACKESANQKIWNENKKKFKYIITQGSGGWRTNNYYSLSEIEYINNKNCIKFLGFSYGKIDTTIVCGDFAIEKYK